MSLRFIVGVLRVSQMCLKNVLGVVSGVPLVCSRVSLWCPGVVMWGVLRVSFGCAWEFLGGISRVSCVCVASALGLSQWYLRCVSECLWVS